MSRWSSSSGWRPWCRGRREAAGQSSGERHEGDPSTAAGRHAMDPRMERRRAATAPTPDVPTGLDSPRARPTRAGLRDRSAMPPLRRAGFARDQPEGGGGAPRIGKPTDLVQRGAITQRGHRADPGRRHPPARHWIRCRRLVRPGLGVAQRPGEALEPVGSWAQRLANRRRQVERGEPGGTCPRRRSAAADRSRAPAIARD